MKPGDFVVGGRNFGLGSSREHAPRIIKLAGVGAVLAQSFARIFFRNAINVGLPVLQCDTARHRRAGRARGRPDRRRGARPHHRRRHPVRAAAAGDGHDPRTTAAWWRTSRSTAASPSPRADRPHDAGRRRRHPRPQESHDLHSDPDPGRRHRPRAGRRPRDRDRRDRRADPVGGARRRPRRDGGVRHAAARARARVHPAHQGRHQGADHDAGRHGLPQRQRGAAQGARPVRLPAPVQDDEGRAQPLRGHRPRRRPREHRGPLRRHRAHGRRRTPPRASRSSPARAASASCASPSSTPAGTAAARSRPCTRPTS